MREEQRKLVKIIAELTTYFLGIGADHISSSIEKVGKKGKIVFHANYSPGCEDKLKELDKLSEQRNDGIEDIYWELAGAGNHGQTSQLLLVGMMVDKAEVTVADGAVDLTMYKELRE